MAVLEPIYRNNGSVSPSTAGQQSDRRILEAGFDRFPSVCLWVHRDAFKGAVFIDPTLRDRASVPFGFPPVIRQADPTLAPFARPEVLEYRLLGLKQESGSHQLCPVEQARFKGGGPSCYSGALPNG